MQQLKCSHCGIVQKMPTHCGKPMHIEGDKFVCWMGSHCGKSDVPRHCGKPMIISE